MDGTLYILYLRNETHKFENAMAIDTDVAIQNLINMSLDMYMIV